MPENFASELREFMAAHGCTNFAYVAAFEGEDTQVTQVAELGSLPCAILCIRHLAMLKDKLTQAVGGGSINEISEEDSSNAK